MDSDKVGKVIREPNSDSVSWIQEASGRRCSLSVLRWIDGKKGIFPENKASFELEKKKEKEKTHL